MRISRYLQTFFYGMRLTAKIPSILLSWRSNRNKAKKHFKQELIAQGVPLRDVEELTEEFPFRLGELLSLARVFS